MSSVIGNLILMADNSGKERETGKGEALLRLSAYDLTHAILQESNRWASIGLCSAGHSFPTTNPPSTFLLTCLVPKASSRTTLAPFSSIIASAGSPQCEISAIRSAGLEEMSASARFLPICVTVMRGAVNLRRWVPPFRRNSRGVPTVTSLSAWTARNSMADVAELMAKMKEEMKEEIFSETNQHYKAQVSVLRNELALAIHQINETLMEKASAAAENALNNVLSLFFPVSDPWNRLQSYAIGLDSLRSPPAHYTLKLLPAHSL
ncbi:hypothetical protein BDK51DRAFT_31876 [Blyttiomyces helicus]|uniref:Uncharacterized protein n=1 Tax=Blyttiomyces helicus TaxID=388810 RepID=A0A4P9WP01_9FUNG|nr:hypothetical protein BDK51DRAFT_31876 [Blyttiomyces helicus]|eukprot:RKO92506.1 hypothetical protein BDK51DRAFT_31876 [Blyttiomyces helicus]